MRLLLDTNVFISVEPTSECDLEEKNKLASQVLQLAHDLGSRILVHPSQRLDLAKDKNRKRRELREALFEKYAPIEPEPPVIEGLKVLFGCPSKGSNDWIDLQLLAALDCEAADFLISEDLRLGRRAQRYGLGKRVLTLEEAKEYLSSLQPKESEDLPLVRSLKAYGLNRQDPIFETLRNDYGERQFDEWLKKCAKEERRCWVVEGGELGSYLGLAIVDSQNFVEEDLENPSLKICTFKISESSRGTRLGELLLRSVFDHMIINQFKSCFLTLYPKQVELLRFLMKFGFFEIEGEEGSHSEELVMGKNFKKGNLPNGDWKDFIRYGPAVVPSKSNSSFVVPIQGPFHDALFPEKSAETDMFQAGRPYGNAMNKAYLCRAKIKTLSRGDLLWFYRSGDEKTIARLGIVEDTLRSDNADDLGRFLTTRTVYPKQLISDYCEKGETLGILFRSILVEFEPISDAKLFDEGILNGPPQSITRVSVECQTWLINRILSP